MVCLCVSARGKQKHSARLSLLAGRRRTESRCKPTCVNSHDVKSRREYKKIMMRQEKHRHTRSGGTPAPTGRVHDNTRARPRDVERKGAASVGGFVSIHCFLRCVLV